MAISKFGTTSDVPRISDDFYYAGSSLNKNHKPFVTREEKFQRIQQAFAKVYKKEFGEKLPTGAKGLVVVQIGHYPLDCDIAINPAITHHCVKPAIYSPTKIMRQSYTFASKTYWLKGSKVELLLDSDSVLSQEECKRAVARIITLKGENFEVLYMGVHLCRIKNSELPFRVWRLQRKDLSVIYLLANLLNGSMFECLPVDLPEMTEAPETFFVGAINFVAEANDVYRRE